MAEEKSVTAAPKADGLAQIMERVVAEGDWSVLTPQQRNVFYNKTCESLGLNPLTNPFQYIRLNGRLMLYARKDATDQLRKIYRVSINITGRERSGDVYTVTAKARTPDGREDESTGVVALSKRGGDDLANLMMKAETKAKRRVTLSICGLGWLDETEVESVRGAEIISREAVEGKAGEEISQMASKCQYEETMASAKRNGWTTAQVTLQMRKMFAKGRFGELLRYQGIALKKYVENNKPPKQNGSEGSAETEEDASGNGDHHE